MPIPTGIVSRMTPTRPGERPHDAEDADQRERGRDRAARADAAATRNAAGGAKTPMQSTGIVPSRPATACGRRGRPGSAGSSGPMPTSCGRSVSAARNSAARSGPRLNPRRSRRTCARATPSARRARRPRGAGSARSRRAPRTPPCRGTARRRGTTAGPPGRGTGRTARSPAPAARPPRAPDDLRRTLLVALLDFMCTTRTNDIRFSFAVVTQPAATGFVIEPSPSISIVISSPGFSQTFGSRNAPTPAGVPVMIRSPARA